ncbi:MAG TPA: copper resistance CopC family protein [Candidatus Saccharimonadales bacterium]|nr:copper resistance CopC family protein [Candidatus Saccharimonadales bacterium]
MKINSIQRWTLVCAFLLAAQFPARAHAFLNHALPKVGSTVKNSPPEVKIWYTQEVEPAFSSIEVQNAQGKEVDKKDVHVDIKNKSLLEVSLPKLPPGTYTVTWHVVSVDTHRTQGRFQFTVE